MLAGYRAVQIAEGSGIDICECECWCLKDPGYDAFLGARVVMNDIC